MVRDDDDLLAVPHPRVLAEMLLEDADGPRPAHVVRHEDVGIDPHIIAGRDVRPAGMVGEDFFGEGHGRHATTPQFQLILPWWYPSPRYALSPRRVRTRCQKGSRH